MRIVPSAIVFFLFDLSFAFSVLDAVCVCDHHDHDRRSRCWKQKNQFGDDAFLVYGVSSFEYDVVDDDDDDEIHYRYCCYYYCC